MASYRLAIRRDTAANWTSEDPTLAQGEFGYEADTGSLKIGDGATAWTALGYYTSVAGANLDNLSDVDTTGAVVGDVLKWDGSAWTPAADNDTDTIYTDVDYIEKQYRYEGALALSTGSVRLYVPSACTGADLKLHLGTTSTSGDVTVDYLLNGAVDTTATIAAGSTTTDVTSATAIAEGDYVTIDITGAGSGAADLYISLSFTRS